MHTLLNGMLKSANNFIVAALKNGKWAKTKRLKNCGTPCSLNQMIIIQSTLDFIYLDTLILIKEGLIHT